MPISSIRVVIKRRNIVIYSPDNKKSVVNRDNIPTLIKKLETLNAHRS